MPKINIYYTILVVLPWKQTCYPAILGLNKYPIFLELVLKCSCCFQLISRNNNEHILITCLFLQISTLDFKFCLFRGPEEAIPAMNRIKELVRKSNITSGDGFKTVWSKAFATWTTDEVIYVCTCIYWNYLHKHRQ